MKNLKDFNLFLNEAKTEENFKNLSPARTRITSDNGKTFIEIFDKNGYIDLVSGRLGDRHTIMVELDMIDDICEALQKLKK